MITLRRRGARAARLARPLLGGHLLRPPAQEVEVYRQPLGRRRRSSLALVFALHHYKPTPLYVMDEIDAALDFRNVSIVGNYTRSAHATRSSSSSRCATTCSSFDRLVGIYKTNNATKSVAIDPAAFTIPSVAAR